MPIWVIMPHMGLREINAARTRELIVDGALELFFEHGYEATTMEDIAGHVGIGISTLYRYFPTKDQLATAPIGDPGLMAAELAGRPASESPEQALGHALTRFLENAGANPEQAKLTPAPARGDPAAGHSTRRVALRGPHPSGARPGSPTGPSPG